MSDKNQNGPEKPGKPVQNAAEERRARQAAALRDNLRRRKQQARELTAPEKAGTEKPE